MGNQSTRYCAPAKVLHWLVALIVLGLIPIGVVMADLDPGPTQDRLFLLHESFGVTILALMLVRVVYRLRRAPAPAPDLDPWERSGSAAIHNALYLLLLLTPLLGWLALSAYGLGPSFYGLGQLPSLLAKDEPLSKILFGFHKAGAFLIAGLATLHVAAVVRHALVKKDKILWRMLPNVWSKDTA